MCGRFALFAGPEELAAAFDVRIEDVRWPPRYNIAPTQQVAIVRARPDEGRQVAHVRWGFVPAWASEPGAGPRMINARAESARTGPAFRAAFGTARCLVPASGFYEWRVERRGKQPYFIGRADGLPMAFAGLWARWARPGWDPLESCVILTTTANDLLAPIHDRMPVILAPGDYAAWLGQTGTSPDALHALCRPCPERVLTAYPVSTAINSPRVDEPACIELVSPASAGVRFAPPSLGPPARPGRRGAP